VLIVDDMDTASRILAAQILIVEDTDCTSTESCAQVVPCHKSASDRVLKV
jgi:hypothetical protein